MSKKKSEYIILEHMGEGKFFSKKEAIEYYNENFDCDIEFTIVKVMGKFISEFPPIVTREV